MSRPDTNLWRVSSAETLAAPGIAEDASADLVIIGGGFTGCSAALEAARRGARVILLEARTIGHGGSGRNVGLVNAGLWLPPDDVLAITGERAGHRLLGALADGPATVWRIIAREDIDCDPVRRGTLHLAHAPAGLRDLRRRHRQGNRLGAPVQLLDAAETARRVGSACFHGALWDPRAGTIQPLAYCRGLARAARAAGARLHENAQATAIRHQAGVWQVESGGHLVRAPLLLMATNAYHDALSGSAGPQFVPVSFSQFATAPLPPDLRRRILPGGEGCWDTATVMTSLRMDRDGRLILGAIGNVEGAGGPVHAAWARRKLRRLFPELAGQPFANVWRGRIAMTGDHVPRIVRLGPGGLNVFGYSGRGIAPGTVFGTAAAAALLKGDEDALPLPVSAAHDERMTALRGICYETGATLAHLAGPVPFR